MKTHINFLFGIKKGMVIFCVLLISACTMPNQGDGRTLSAEIVQPIDGAQVPQGLLLEVQTRVSTSGNVESATLLVNGQVDREDLFTDPAFTSGTVYQPWTPQDVGIYLLQVILNDGQGEVTSNIVTVTVIEAAPISLTVTLSPTVISTETPTITITPTPENPVATANQDVNCRRGPSTAYAEMSALLQEETALITGSNQDGSWYYVDLGSIQCWVWGEAVTVSGNLADVPLVIPPPLPITETPSPVPAYLACHDYPDLVTCSDDPMGFGGCTWDTGTNKCQP